MRKGIKHFIILIFFEKSFIPNAICKWNALPIDVIKPTTLGQFRIKISNFSKDSSAPMHFNFGKRML